MIDAPALNLPPSPNVTKDDSEALQDTLSVHDPPGVCVILEYQCGSMPLAMHRFQGRDQLIVGRSSQCPLSIDEDQSLSRQHFLIEFQDGTPVVRDLESRNGTTVNGLSISECHLNTGDQITAGNTRFTVWISR
ncbi:MAG: FHA domain-containing protein [Planctomycetota bacterium]